MNRWLESARRWLPPLAVCLTASGCLPVNPVQRADTLGRGRWQLAVEPSLVGSQPELEVSGRYGVSDRVDLGARVGTLGLELQSRIQLTPREPGRLTVSIAPSVGGAVFSGLERPWSGVVHARLPLLLGLRVGQDSQWVLSPRVGFHALLAQRDSVPGQSATSRWALTAGTSMGFCFQITPRFALFPELGFELPLRAQYSQDGATAATPFAPTAQLSLGVLWEASHGSGT